MEVDMTGKTTEGAAQAYNAPGAAVGAVNGANEDSVATARTDLAGRELNADGTVIAGQQPKRFLRGGLDGIWTKNALATANEDSVFKVAGGVFDGVPSAMRQQQDTAIEKAMKTIASLSRGVKQVGIANALKQMTQPSQPTPTQPQSPSAQVSPQAKPADAQPKPVGGQAAQAAGITMRNVRGVEKPEYLRGATAVQVPSWVDINDDNAVSGFVDESNEVVGWMDGSNDEEEV